LAAFGQYLFSARLATQAVPQRWKPVTQEKVQASIVEGGVASQAWPAAFIEGSVALQASHRVPQCSGSASAKQAEPHLWYPVSQARSQAGSAVALVTQDA